MMVALWIALSALSLGRAHAQPAEAITDEQRERARPIVDQANAAFDQNDYVAALERYREAYAIAPVDTLRFNVARCLERLARFREAATEWEALTASAALDEGQRATATEQLAFVRARLGTVVVEAPSYERVTIDGELECAIPCELALDPGSHVAVAQGANEARRSFELARGERLVLRFEPPGAIAHETAAVDDDPGSSFSVSWLGWTGVALATAGAAAAVAFGVWTIALLDDFDLNPRDAAADEGDIAWGLTLGGIGLAGTGIALMLIDFLAQPFAD
jgi:hypothetical protein